MSENSKPKKNVLVGYQRKPLWIFFFALFIIWLPLIAFLLAIGEDWHKTNMWPHYISRIPTISWVMVILLEASGLAILFVRKFSLLLMVSVLLVISFINIAIYKQIPIPAVIILLIIAIPPFRRPFLNPRLRWWERNERLMALGRRILLGHQQVSLELHDISASGAFIKFVPRPIPVKAQTVIDITLEQGLHIKAKIMRVAEDGFAIHYHELTKEQKQGVENYLNDLKKGSS